MTNYCLEFNSYSKTKNYQYLGIINRVTVNIIVSTFYSVHEKTLRNIENSQFERNRGLSY